MPNFATADLGFASRLLLDEHRDFDHNRTVLSLADASVELLGTELLTLTRHAVEHLDLRRHHGLHPRVGVADVLPLVPLGAASVEAAVAEAHHLGKRIWQELRVPVYFFGDAGAGRRLAEIRAGFARPDLGGPEPHPTAGACCVGVRPPLVAYNVVFPTLPDGAAAAMRALPGVQALTFTLPDGRRQLSLNLTRLAETGVPVALERARRLAGSDGTPELVGLCPAAAAGPGCDGGLLEAHLAAAAARRAADRAMQRAGEEIERLTNRLRDEAASLARIAASPEAILGGAERAAALVRVLSRASLAEADLAALLLVAADGFRIALPPGVEDRFAKRLELLDRWLTGV